jgi:AcrR family transcriptional regulator
VDDTAPVPYSRPALAGRRRDAILATAARLFYERGFEATSIQDVAEACGLTKPGLYHHIRSKEDLLLEVLHCGLDLFEAQVVQPTLCVPDPEERLRAWVLAHLRLIHRPGHREASLLLHERLRLALASPAQARVRARKRRVLRLLEACVAELLAHRAARAASPKLAASGLLGMVVFTSHWYRPDGPLSCERLAQELTDLFLRGLLAAPADAPGVPWTVTPGWLGARPRH